MTRTIATLLAIATIAGVAAPATAQTKYFARERLVGLTSASNGTPAAKTYVPTYSNTYGACSNKTKSKSIASCAQTDGTPAALSDCASFPQSKDAIACSQSSVCGNLYQGRQGTGSTKASEYIGSTQTFSDAESRCSVAASTRPGGVCRWDNTPNGLDGYAIYYMEGATLVTGAPTTRYSTQCIEK